MFFIRGIFCVTYYYHYITVSFAWNGLLFPCILSNTGEKSVLDIPILNTEQVSQVAFGSAGEVERFEQYVGRKYI